MDATPAGLCAIVSLVSTIARLASRTIDFTTIWEAALGQHGSNRRKSSRGTPLIWGHVQATHVTRSHMCVSSHVIFHFF